MASNFTINVFFSLRYFPTEKSGPPNIPSCVPKSTPLSQAVHLFAIPPKDNLALTGIV